jgi:hypothetical protein
MHDFPLGYEQSYLAFGICDTILIGAGVTYTHRSCHAFIKDYCAAALNEHSITPRYHAETVTCPEGASYRRITCPEGASYVRQ